MFDISIDALLALSGLWEDWLYQLSHPHKIKPLLTYLLTYFTYYYKRHGPVFLAISLVTHQ